MSMKTRSRDAGASLVDDLIAAANHQWLQGFFAYPDCYDFEMRKSQAYGAGWHAASLQHRRLLQGQPVIVRLKQPRTGATRLATVEDLRLLFQRRCCFDPGHTLPKIQSEEGWIVDEPNLMLTEGEDSLVLRRKDWTPIVTVLPAGRDEDYVEGRLV